MADYNIVLVTPKPKASANFAGANEYSGCINCEAVVGGVVGNSIQLALAIGPTGPGNESLALRVTVVSDDITVEFATDGAGASVTPTAQQVIDLVNADPQASPKVLLSCSGDGSGLVAAFALTTLTGGAESSTTLVIDEAVSLYDENNDPVLVSALVPDDVFRHKLGGAMHIVLTAGVA